MNLKSQQGFSKIKALLLVTVLVIGGHLGWKAFYFHYCYWDVEELMQHQANKGVVFKDEEIRAKILKNIQENGIPYYPEDDINGENFTIVRSDKIYIDLKYTEVLAIDFGGDYYYEIKEFPFHAHAEAELPGG